MFLNSTKTHTKTKMAECLRGHSRWPLFFSKIVYVTHLYETSRMSAEFVFRYGSKCMGGVILPILVVLHL